MKTLKFDVFGKRVLIIEINGAWAVFYVGVDGKRRPAIDIVIPPDIPETDIEQYLGDLCHEWATIRHPIVKRLDSY